MKWYSFIHTQLYQFTDLDAVVVGVGDDDVVLRVDRHSRRLRELPLEHAELAELRWMEKQIL